MMENLNLTASVKKSLADMEINGGIWWKDLPPGSSVRMLTQNTEYLLEKRPDGDYICGNLRYCSTPTKASIHGSTFGGSMIRVGWLGVGMHLEFSVPGYRRITTTQIQDVQLQKAKQ